MLQLTHSLKENTHFRKQIYGLDTINENKKHFIESQTLEIETDIRTYVPPYQYCVISRNSNVLWEKKELPLHSTGYGNL